MIKQYKGLIIDESRTALLENHSVYLLKTHYLRDDESVQEGFARACLCFGSNLEHSQRLYDYVSKKWFMFSSPVLSNAVYPGEKIKNMPISCFLPYVNDDIPSLMFQKIEFSLLSVMGGGVGQYWGDIRAVSDKSPGPIPFIHELDGGVLAWKQGKTRRAALATYINIHHPDIRKFIKMRTPTGDVGSKALNVHHGVCITDDFMQAVERGDEEYNLICSHTKNVISSVNPRELFVDILETRARTGEPFLYFVDEANRQLPMPQKILGLKSHASNLCFTGDTLVAVADYRKAVSIKQLAEESCGLHKFFVYCSVDPTSNENTIQTAVAFKTGKFKVIKLHLSDGGSIECTPDHILFTSEGKEIKAKDSKGSCLRSFTKNNFIFVDYIIDDGKEVDVYDLTVDEAHNFYIYTTGYNIFDSVLVHNCTEITLPQNKDRTPVCCLSSVNAEEYDSWKTNKQFIHDIIEMLDNVIGFFIKHVDSISESYTDDLSKELLKLALSKVKNSAKAERSLGLGVMGFHYYLQQHHIPFESEEARSINKQLFKFIKSEAHKKSCDLGLVRGPAPDIIEAKANSLFFMEQEETQNFWKTRRNLHLLAVAPNANNSVILGTSPSIEPSFANLYAQELRIGHVIVKNKYLIKYLDSIGKNTENVWESIAQNKSSVQHLDFLDDHIKSVFKTAMEIDQQWVITHAADRQKYICQAQSINLFFKSMEDINHVVKVHINAWKSGLKSLYYYRTKTASKIENVSESVSRETLESSTQNIVYGKENCSFCKEAKDLLNESGIQYQYIDLDQLNKTAAQVTGRDVKTVPQIYLFGEYIGGCSELKNHLFGSGNTQASNQDDSCIACEG